MLYAPRRTSVKRLTAGLSAYAFSLGSMGRSASLLPSLWYMFESARTVPSGSLTMRVWGSKTPGTAEEARRSKAVIVCA